MKSLHSFLPAFIVKSSLSAKVCQNHLRDPGSAFSATIQSHPVGIGRPPAISCFTCTAVKLCEMVVTCHLLILNLSWLRLREKKVPQNSIVYHHGPHENCHRFNRLGVYNFMFIVKQSMGNSHDTYRHILHTLVWKSEFNIRA